MNISLIRQSFTTIHIRIIIRFILLVGYHLGKSGKAERVYFDVPKTYLITTLMPLLM